jgi:Protein of unknown function (DUF2793)
MSDTINLELPLIAASQAQKHVTHNEALAIADAIVQLAVISRALTAPPASPVDGDRYLIAASATGVWSTHDGELAFYLDGAWRFATPRNGWRLWSIDEEKLLAFDGSAWRDVQDIDELQGMELLGINATADPANRLTVASPNVLFTHESGDQRVKINKNAAGDTAACLFQANFSGRAEIGLAGDDNLHFKVSSDGATWHEALVLNRNTGSQLLKHVDVAAATSIDDAHLGRIIRADASGGAFNVTLPASADTDDWVIVRKKDSSANRVTVKNSGDAAVAWLSGQHDWAMFAWWDGGFVPVGWSVAPITSAYTASGSETKPPLAKRALVALWGGGGGGGSGRRGAAGSARSGGVGGWGSQLHENEFLAASLSGTIAITIGAGGTGGAAVASDNGNGADGTDGGDTTFGSYLRAKGGHKGYGGTNAATATGGTDEDSAGQTAATASSVTLSLQNIAGAVARGGCAGGTGGSLSTANAELSGHRGGYPTADPSLAPTAKGSAGSAGSNGASSSIAGLAGAGGGAGGANPSGAGGNGGVGGRGSGGGGGGASVNGSNSGAGGNGGDGLAYLTWYFD